MLGADKNLFLSIPNESVLRILHPGTVVSVEHDIYTAELEEEDVPLEEGQEVFIYYEIDHTFMKQPARLETVTQGDPKTSISFATSGAPVSAEDRDCYRVPTAFKGLTVTVDPEKSCDLLDVSGTGFAVTASEHYGIGELVEVALRFRSEAFSGRACLQSMKKLGEGRIRYGLYCVDQKIAAGSLSRGLHAISLAIQREHLRALRSR
jgi:hypothetical protein